jgi:predicted TIM-barrel fold metal-dependent hydrolase
MPSIDSRQRMPRIFPQSRRAFLQGLAAACVPAVLPWAGARAQMPVKPTAIDVHHHWYSMELLKSWGRDTFDPNWTTAASLARMDEAGVATSMLSVTMPGVWKSTDVPGSVALARQCNERMTQTAHDHPGRFGVLAALPLPQIDASLAEIAYALDVLHADGIGLLSNYDSVPLGDPRFAPVFEELNRRKAVVYIHPMAPACCMGLVPGLGAGALEAPTDTARSIASLLITGTLSRLTDMQVVVAAGGGTLPFIGDRLINSATQAGRNAAEPDKKYFAPDTLRAALGRLHIDTANVTNPADWAALMTFTTPGQVLFGSDSPFSTDAQCLEQLRAMEQRFSMPAADAAAIEYGNAQKLFPARFKSKP